MELERTDHGWKAADSSRLSWGEFTIPNMLAVFVPSENLPSCFQPCVMGGAAPTHVKASVMQYSANGTERFLSLAKLTHVRSVNGGIRRRAGETQGVDCKSHTYSVYMLEFLPGHPQTVIAVNHGGGSLLYLIPHCFADETMRYACAMLPDGAVWDICDMIVDGFNHGREHGASRTAAEYATAFVEGRLKKRRKNGQVRVHVEPARQPVP